MKQTLQIFGLFLLIVIGALPFAVGFVAALIYDALNAGICEARGLIDRILK